METMPQLVSLVVHDCGMCDELVHAWVEAGVTGLTLLDSSGLSQHLQREGIADDIPLFPSVRRLLKETEQTSRTVFSVVDDEFDLDRLVAVTERVLGRLSEPETGILFVTPVTRVVGLRGPGG
jgi:nitrogen regulatory protein P-II 1